MDLSQCNHVHGALEEQEKLLLRRSCEGVVLVKDLSIGSYASAVLVKGPSIDNYAWVALVKEPLSDSFA
jgi:hypothetical protein